MCLIISQEDNYSFLGITEIRNKNGKFAMLGYKEFAFQEKNDKGKLYSIIYNQYQYYFALNNYGIRALNDNSTQKIRLSFNNYFYYYHSFDHKMRGNIISENVYSKKRMGYHISAFQIPDEESQHLFYHLNRIYSHSSINTMQIPVMFFNNDIQMISGNEAVVRNFTILKPELLETILIKNNLYNLLIWEGNNNFMENYKKMYELLINSMKIYSLGEKNV